VTGLWLALGFLSRVPVVRVEFTAAALRRSLFWFPAVGVLLGLLWTGIHWTAQLWAPGLGAFALVFCGVLFTGALHLDGLADTFDGLSAASAGSEKALAAMKDSRIGAHGAVALAVALLGKYAAFSTLDPAASAIVCLAAAIMPRWCCAVALAVARPARLNGLGAAFAQAGDARSGLSDKGATSGLVMALLGAFWLCVPLAAAGLEGGRWLTIAILFTLGVVVACAAVWRFVRAFGGVTGDTHGALIELCETMLLLAGAALGRSLK
jgi:adenosylcobinamide-GDP ribazoletransferase